MLGFSKLYISLMQWHLSTKHTLVAYTCFILLLFYTISCLVCVIDKIKHVRFLFIGNKVKAFLIVSLCNYINLHIVWSSVLSQNFVVLRVNINKITLKIYKTFVVILLLFHTGCLGNIVYSFRGHSCPLWCLQNEFKVCCILVNKA